MSVESRKPFGFKILMNYILEEIQDDSLFDGLWKSIDAFNSSYGNAEYPIDDQPPIPIPFDFRYADITYIENFSYEDGGVPNTWASKSEYFFKLASNHERIVDVERRDHTSAYTDDGTHYSVFHDDYEPSEVTNVGDGHRQWLDVNRLYSAMDYEGAPVGETHVATGKQDAARRIEYLSQIVKVCILADDNDFDAANPGFIDGQSDVSNTITDYVLLGGGSYGTGRTNFMEEHGYIQFNFTSPHRLGRQRTSEGLATSLTYPDYFWTEPAYPLPDDFDLHSGPLVLDDSHHPSSYSPADRGLRAELEEEYQEYGRFINNDILNGTARPFLNHVQQISNNHFEEDIIYSADPDDKLHAVRPSLRWEEWQCRANFESFLLWSSDLIELLNVYYAATDWSSQISDGNKPVFAGGKRYMSYPKYDSPASTLDMQDLRDGNAGYQDMSLDLIADMLEEINRVDLLIPESLKDWWRDFLGSYKLSAEEAGPTAEDAADEAVEGAVDEGLSAGAPEQGSTIDITVCTPEEISQEEECPDECVKDPGAFVIDWTLLDDGATFFNQKTCEYSVVVRLEQDNPYSVAAEDLTGVLRTGTQMLLAAFLKAEYLLSEYEESVFVQTLTGYEGDEGSIATIDVIFDTTGTLINNQLGFLPEADDLPRIPENGVYVPEKPSLKPRVLVSVPAKLFDKIPFDYSSIREIEPPEIGTRVQFLVSDIDSTLFSNDMVSDVYSAMRYYNVEYAKFCQFSTEVDYGDLNLEEEGKKIKSFMEDLKKLVRAYGYSPLRRLEHIEIGFNEELTGLTYLRVNEHGCPWAYLKGEDPDIESAKSILWNFSGDNWTDRRTLAYVQQMPNMWNDVNARQPLGWNEFIIKYTVDLKNSLAIDEGMPESASECFIDGLESVGSKILSETLNDIVDLPTAILDKWNRKACSITDYKRNDDVDYAEMWSDIKTAALERGMEDFFAGDAAGEMIKQLIEDGEDLGPITLWKTVLDKYGWCGVLALVDLLMGCLLQGIPTADGLALLIEAALRSLGPLELERVLLGLTPQQQDAIAAQVSESLGVIAAAPPWESEYKAGSWNSSSPFNPQSSAYERSMAAGEGYYNDLEKDEDGNLNLTSSAANDAYVSTLITEGEGQGYKDLATYIVSATPEGVSGAEIEILQEKGLDGEIDLIWPASSGVGTIAKELDVVSDAIVEAYMDAILGSLSPEQQLASLNALPGAEIYASVLDTLDCAVPDVFDPPLGDWFKSLELDFCRGIEPPTFKFDYDFALPDLWGMLMDALQEMAIQLITTALLKTLSAILEMLLNSLCKLMGSFGAGIAALGEGTFRDAFRDVFCDSEISDEELDEGAAQLIANLNGCDPEILKQYASGFITDLSLVLTGQELVDLFNGEANSRTLGAIAEVAELLYGDSFGACPGFSSASGVDKTFSTFGKLVDDKYKKAPVMAGANRPIAPSLCDEEALEEFESLRCDLFSQRGMTAEECADALQQLRNRTKDDIKSLADFKQNGLKMPPLISPDPCGNSIFPAVDPVSAAAASSASGGMLDLLAKHHREDLTANQNHTWYWGSGGLINLIMSSKRGDEFTRHLDKIQDDEANNEFPEAVATHLKEILINGEHIDSVQTTTNISEFTGKLGIDYPMEFVTDMDSGDLGKAATADSDYEEKQVIQKDPDIVLTWEDYNTGDNRVDCKISYTDFEIVNDRSVMNDYYRLKNTDRPTTPFISGEIEIWGFEGEQKTEDAVKELVGLAELIDPYAEEPVSVLDLDIGQHLDLKRSPKHSLFAHYITEAMKYMSPSAAIEANYDSIFDEYYNSCDGIVEAYLGKLSERIADDSNPAFVHGFPTTYDAAQNYDTGTSTPSIINLDATYVNPKTGIATPISPESYGGTVEYPAFYLPIPTFDGWGRILQAFAPTIAGCEPQAKAACNFEQLSEYYDNLYNTIVEDERMFQNPVCAVEHPWNKILDRASTCGIEMALLATIRVYVSEHFISGMPVFSIFEGKFPSLFDDTVIDYIIDKMETGIMNQWDPGWFDVPNEYLFMILEQGVQTFDRMYARGEIKDITSAEQEAIDHLNKWQDKWEKEVSPVLTSYQFGSTVSAGIMTSIASPFGSTVQNASAAILGGSINALFAKRLKRKYWTSYVAEANNIKYAKVLMRRLVRQEIEFVSKTVAEDIEPPISDMHNLFLVNEKMILGSLSEGGPWHVASSIDNVTLQHDYLTEVESPERRRVPDTPFMLERYIKVTDYEYDSDGKVKETIPLMALEALSDTQRDIVRRVGMPNLQGIVNIEDWEDYLSENVDLFSGLTVDQLWASWEFGIRITHVTTSSEPSGVTPEERLLNKAFSIGDFLLIPMVSTEKESASISGNNIENIIGSLSAVYDSELACLVSDLVKSPKYEMLFGYCISLPRMLSLLTIYVMKTFLSSIGSEKDWSGSYTNWRGTHDFEPGGIRRPFGITRFYGWNRETLMERSKKVARSIYLGYYKATDLDWQTPPPEKSSNGWGGISWSLFWWLRKLQKHKPFDSEGNPCA